ncbi:hypothetical protein A2125_00505 [Candidatus Woesebacteria bacterium GWB1_43_5]|uniref:Uncharacterized protein n=1 Tax=Candidatus Woesebacteria bacterium GWB1_43_5 TaxID=1802474 RepID=A0A1F7WRL2_9BACT|nr:MAG: hypothetical protein A2125_00505 [Candidatus Woesebacteria bacterium GWB1_43_5]
MEVDLPKQIKVKVSQNKKGGVFLAELPDYDVFTEADTFSGLIFMVNDLIYTFFDVPKKLRGKIWYSPPLKTNLELNLPMNPILFSILTFPKANSNLNDVL